MGFQEIYFRDQEASQGKGVKSMHKLLLKHTIRGFVLGMAMGNLIAIIGTAFSEGKVIVLSEALLTAVDHTAAALTVQTLLSGLLGAIAMAGAVLYEVERLGMLFVAILHYIIIVAAYFPIAALLGWVVLTPGWIGFMALVKAFGYAVVWVILHIKYCVRVRELNRLLLEFVPESA